MGAPTSYGGHFWIGDDDPSTQNNPNSITWDASEDTGRTSGQSGKFHIRFQVYGTNFKNNTLALFYNTTSSMTNATEITTSTANDVAIVDSDGGQSIADGTSITTAKCTAQSGYTWMDGKYVDTSSNFGVISVDGEYTELQACLEFTANASSSTTYYFFVGVTGGIALTSYDNVPSVKTVSVTTYSVSGESAGVSGVSGSCSMENTSPGTITATSGASGAAIVTIEAEGSVVSTSGANVSGITDIEASGEVASAVSMTAVPHIEGGAISISGTISSGSAGSASEVLYAFYLSGGDPDDIGLTHLSGGNPTSVPTDTVSGNDPRTLHLVTMDVMVSGVIACSAVLSSTSALSVEASGVVTTTSWASAAPEVSVGAAGGIACASAVIGNAISDIQVVGLVQAVSDFYTKAITDKLAISEVSATASFSGHAENWRMVSGTITATASFSVSSFKENLASGSIDAVSGTAGSAISDILASGSISGASTVSGHVEISIEPACSIQSVSTLEARLEVMRECSGMIEISCNITGFASNDEYINISGTVTIASGVVTEAVIILETSGFIDSQAFLETLFAIVLEAVGQVTASSTFEGNVKAYFHVVGEISAASGASGDAVSFYERNVSGQINAQADATSSIVLYIGIEGLVAPVSSLEGTLAKERVFSGVIEATGVFNGSLYVNAKGGKLARLDVYGNLKIKGKLVTGGSKVSFDPWGYLTVGSLVDGAGMMYIDGDTLYVNSLDEEVPING